VTAAASGDAWRRLCRLPEGSASAGSASRGPRGGQENAPHAHELGSASARVGRGRTRGRRGRTRDERGAISRRPSVLRGPHGTHRVTLRRRPRRVAVHERACPRRRPARRCCPASCRQRRWARDRGRWSRSLGMVRRRRAPRAKARGTTRVTSDDHPTATSRPERRPAAARAGSHGKVSRCDARLGGTGAAFEGRPQPPPRLDPTTAGEADIEAVKVARGGAPLAAVAALAAAQTPGGCGRTTRTSPAARGPAAAACWCCTCVRVRVCMLPLYVAVPRGRAVRRCVRDPCIGARAC
jgi:hypothetical protein